MWDFILFLSFVYPFFILLAKWIKIGFPRYKRQRAEEKCGILSFFYPLFYHFLSFYILLAAKWIKMKIQMRIKKGYPGQGQEDKKMIKNDIKKKGYPKLRKNQGHISNPKQRAARNRTRTGTA